MMVALPDGRYVILGGAYNGRAGFGLQRDPNLSAVMYDPTKPVGARMTVLANTTIPRLYHSEAVLMSDGRILVSGSDPQMFGVWPQEHRLEYFSPDYILSGAPKPTFTVPNKDWAYGETVAFTVDSSSGSPASSSAASATTVPTSISNIDLLNTNFVDMTLLVAAAIQAE